MLNVTSFKAVDSSKFSKSFVRPLYDSYCFSRIPSTIQSLFTSEWSSSALPQDVMGDLPRKYKNIILLFVDSFGWRFYEEFKESYDFLKRFEREGCVSKLTTQFPSTTAAHVTTLRTGLPVYATGIYEWFYYEPKVGAMISPLIFSYVGDKQRNTLEATGLKQSDIFPKDSFYRNLQKEGVQSHIVQYYTYTPTKFSDPAYEMVTSHPFGDLKQACELLTKSVLSSEGQNYYYFYYDVIDTTGHNSGLQSREFKKAVHNFFKYAEKEIYSKLAGKTEDTLIILTADHGQESISPIVTRYIDKELPGFGEFIACDPNTGNLLVPAGSSRDFFLHIKPEKLSEAQNLLSKTLEGTAEVYTSEELFKAGIFGAEATISTALKERVGNLVVLPLEGQSVYWSANGKYTERFYGHHGGLLKSEMETLFLALKL